MSERLMVRGPDEGKTLLVGGGDLVTYTARSAETGNAYFCFQVSTTPGFKPLHTHVTASCAPCSTAEPAVGSHSPSAALFYRLTDASGRSSMSCRSKMGTSRC